MWTIDIEAGPDRRVLHGVVRRRQQRPATFDEVVHALRDDADFRTTFNAALADAPFTAFRWETPVVTHTTTQRSFEFVIVDSPGLAVHPEPEAFAEHFVGAPASGVVVIPNLGGDAILVVPCELAPASAYGHVAAFVRDAPAAQRDTLWQAVGDAMLRRISARPVWLSTAGGGVAWLHVRLDDRPKYYAWAPYRRLDSA